jgi:hypothetical protein
MDEQKRHQRSGRVIDINQQYADRLTILNLPVFTAINLDEFADTGSVWMWLIHSR